MDAKKNKALYKDLVGICFAPQDASDSIECPQNNKWNECKEPCEYYSNFLSANEFIYGSKYSPRAWSSKLLLSYVDYAITDNNNKIDSDPEYKEVKLVTTLPPPNLLPQKRGLSSQKNEDVMNIKTNIIKNDIDGDKLLNIITDVVNYMKLDKSKNKNLFSIIRKHIKIIFSQKMIERMFKGGLFKMSLDTNFRYFFGDLYDIMKNMDEHISNIPKSNLILSHLWAQRVSEFYDDKYARVTCTAPILRLNYEVVSYINDDIFVKEKNKSSSIYLRIKEFIDNITKCLKSTFSYIIIPLSLHVRYVDDANCIKRNSTIDYKGHRNILFYDKNKRILTRYEPYGATTIKFYESKFLDNAIHKIFSYAGVTDIKYIMPHTVCPNIIADMPRYGIQQLEKNMEHNADIPRDGYCVTWSYAYLISRLAHPSKTNEEIQKNMMGDVQIDKYAKGGDRTDTTDEYKKLVNMISVELRALMENIVLVSKLDPFYRIEYPEDKITCKSIINKLNEGKEINIIDISQMIFNDCITSMHGDEKLREEFKNAYDKITAYIDKTHASELLYDDIVASMINSYNEVLTCRREDDIYKKDLDFIAGVIIKTDRVGAKLDDRIVKLHADEQDLNAKILDINKENEIIAEIKKNRTNDDDDVTALFDLV